MISWMAMDFFAKSPVLALPLLGLCLFVSAFAAVSIRAALTSRDELDALAKLPLDEGNRHE